MTKPGLIFLEREQVLACPTCAESYGVRTHVMRDPARFAEYTETMSKRHLCRKRSKPAKVTPAPTPTSDPWRDAWAAYERTTHAPR